MESFLWLDDIYLEKLLNTFKDRPTKLVFGEWFYPESETKLARLRMAIGVWTHCWLVLVVFVGFDGLNGYPIEDLVKGLPGQPKVEFRQFAGYIDVDVNARRSLFYYFVEAEQDPDHKPLTLWLNGG